MATPAILMLMDLAASQAGLSGRTYVTYDGTDVHVVVAGVDVASFQGSGAFLVHNRLALVQSDENEYVDSLADGYLDLGATTAVRFQNAAADTDVVTQWVGTSNTGALTWMEDEDYFKFSDDVLIDSNEKIQFRDTAIYIFSQADGYLNVVADSGVRIGDATPTNYTQFDSTGHQTMVGTARPWRDALTDALSLQQSGAGVSRNATEGTVDFANNAVYHATFTSADAMYCNIQMNHDKDLSASVYPHIHWFQAAGYNPNWLLEYRWQINGGAKTTSWTKLKCNTPAFTYASGTIHQIHYSAAIAVPVGTTLSDILQFRIYRDTTDASGEFGATCPYNTGGNRTASVLAFDCHFQINSLGSDDQYTK